MRGWIGCLSGLALVACSGPEPANVADTPTGFDFRRVDLIRDQPNDLCRAKNPDFLQNLLNRVGGALPVEDRSTMTFHDFHVARTLDGKGSEAVLRFKSGRGDQTDVLMYAYGDFDPATCAIINLRVGVGPTPHITGEQGEIPVV